LRFKSFDATAHHCVVLAPGGMLLSTGLSIMDTEGEPKQGGCVNAAVQTG